MGAAPMQVPKKNGIKCACNEKNVILKIKDAETGKNHQNSGCNEKNAKPPPRPRSKVSVCNKISVL